MANLPLRLVAKQASSKLTQKARQQLAKLYAQPILIIDERQALSLQIAALNVSPNWQSLQRRVVRAGRKSEMLLQACKLTEAQSVLDATAGFGHDSLILASTGAKVTLLERNPLMLLLLLHEQHSLATQPQWHKLMRRLTLVYDDAMAFMQQLQPLQPRYAVVYLDPMFPQHSYADAKTGKGAKVGKHMQALHHLAAPPDLDEEKALLDLACRQSSAEGRVVVKRPVAAPHLAQRLPDETWQNQVVRFDGYFAALQQPLPLN